MENLLKEFATGEDWEFGAVQQCKEGKYIVPVDDTGRHSRVFRPHQVKKFIYNGGKCAVLRTREDWEPTEFPIPCMYKADCMVPWYDEELGDLAEVIEQFRFTRVIRNGEPVWRGYGYWMIEQKFGDEPLSDDFSIEAMLDGKWKKLTDDPRGKVF